MSEYSPEIPTIIKACLTRGIVVHPYQLPNLISRAKTYAVPYDILISPGRFDLIEYVDALGYDSSCAGGYNGWSKAHERLKALGFIETERRENHRVFISLEYPVKD